MIGLNLVVKHPGFPPLFGINRVVKERVYPLDLKWSYTVHYLPFDGPTTDH